MQDAFKCSGLVAPTWPALLLACEANHAAGPASMTELAVMRGQLHELRLAIARIVGVIGWPAVEFDGYRIGKGVAAWTEFLMADYIFTFDPLLLPRAASEAEAITNGATDGARSPKRH